MINEEFLWAKFAAASISEGNNVGGAADVADRMVKEFKKRFARNPLVQSDNDAPSSHRVSNEQ